MLKAAKVSAAKRCPNTGILLVVELELKRMADANEAMAYAEHLLEKHTGEAEDYSELASELQKKADRAEEIAKSIEGLDSITF